MFSTTKIRTAAVLLAATLAVAAAGPASATPPSPSVGEMKTLKSTPPSTSVSEKKMAPAPVSTPVFRNVLDNSAAS